MAFRVLCENFTRGIVQQKAATLSLGQVEVSALTFRVEGELRQKREGDGSFDPATVSSGAHVGCTGWF